MTAKELEEKIDKYGWELRPALEYGLEEYIFWNEEKGRYDLDYTQPLVQEIEKMLNDRYDRQFGNIND